MYPYGWAMEHEFALSEVKAVIARLSEQGYEIVGWDFTRQP